MAGVGDGDGRGCGHPEHEAETLERRERVWAQLVDGRMREMACWVLATRVLYLSVTCFALAFLTGLALIVGSVVYGCFTRPDELVLLTKYGDLLAGVIKGSMAGFLLSCVGIVVVNALAVSFLRRRMRRAGVSEEDASALLPESTAPPWWKVELSWGHLVLWVGLPILVCMWRDHSSFPDWTVGVFIYLLVMWFFKGAFMLQLLTSNDADIERWRGQYRFFGTPRGAAVGLVGLPAVLAVLAYGIWLLMDLVGF